MAAKGTKQGKGDKKWGWWIKPKKIKKGKPLAEPKAPKKPKVKVRKH